jgi:hypothetical protein
MIERRLEEIEDGSLSAPPLSEVISQDAAGDEMTTIQEVGVQVKVRRSPKSIPLPITTEQFRQRIETLAISYILAAYKHSSRLWLRTASMQVWDKFVRYILSDEIALYALDSNGISVRATWDTVLMYEHQIRKLAVRKILFESFDFETAMEAARTDLVIKERYFISPTAILSAMGRNGGSSASAPQSSTQGAAVPGGRGPGGGLSNKQKRAAKATSSKAPVLKTTAKKGKGKGSKGSNKTPDGRIICLNFNTLKGCSYANCKFVHVCSSCFDTDHTVLTCK